MCICCIVRGLKCFVTGLEMELSEGNVQCDNTMLDKVSFRAYV